MFEILNTIATSIGWGFMGLIVSLLLWKAYVKIVLRVSQLFGIQKGNDK